MSNKKGIRLGIYAHSNQLYRGVKTEGSVTYLKCMKSGCDGSTKYSYAFTGLCCR